MAETPRADADRPATAGGRARAWLHESSAGQRFCAGAAGSVAIGVAVVGLDRLIGGAIGGAIAWMLVPLSLALLAGGVVCLRLARPGADVIAGLLLGWLAQLVLLVAFAVVLLSGVEDL